jgi:hypoxanthine phosphoribosyltransferase
MESAEPPKLPLTWGQIHDMVKTISTIMHAADYYPTTILGIGHGGIIPAAHLAYYHGKVHRVHPHIDTIYAWSYMQDGSLKMPLRVEWPGPERMVKYIAEGSSLLLVDDIADSGETLSAFSKALPQARTATLIRKASSEFEPTFAGTFDDCKNPWWYVFPWEVPECDTIYEPELMRSMRTLAESKRDS